LLFEYLCTLITLYTSSYYHITENFLHIISIVIKPVYLHLGNPVINTVTLASDGTCVELSAAWSNVPHHTCMWWGPPLESVVATSRILTPPGIGWGGCLWCSFYRYCYWPNSVLL